MTSIGQVLRWASDKLHKAGVADPYSEAQILLSHVLKVPRVNLVRDSEKMLSRLQLLKYRRAVVQRQKRRPTAYILGRKPFMHWEFYVTPGVLIPRPETETMVELAVEALRGKPRPLVADIGTGSGVVGLSIAALVAQARVHAVDISRRALTVARRNARMLGVSSRVHFHRGDLLVPLERWRGKFDCIVANLPYLSVEDYAALAPELYHEPRGALVAEPDVASLYRRMLSAAVGTLRPGGLVVMEIGSGHHEMVESICKEQGFVSIEVIKDLAGHNRIIRCLSPAKP